MAEPRPDLFCDETISAAECARQVLPGLASEFFAAGRDVVRSSPTPKRLHKLRLAAKRFRYTLELFRQCYEDGLERHLKALGRLQSHLGSFNDCQVAVRLVKSDFKEVSGCQEFLQFLVENGDERRNTCLRYWHRTFDAPGRERFWLESLSSPVKEHASKRPVDQIDTRPGEA
jgi:CHAD domain-containing protein